MKRMIACSFILPLILGGCNMLDLPAYVLFGGHKSKVKAEYAGLENTRTAIFVVAGPAIEFEYPYARKSLALWIAHYIKENVPSATFVDQERIDDFQRERLDWYELSVPELAERFNAQQVLYLDLIRFTMREENSVNLLRGNVIADVRVYDLQQDAVLPVYQTEITAMYPEHNPMPMGDAAWQVVQRETMEHFAQILAKKFYDHEIADD